MVIQDILTVSYLGRTYEAGACEQESRLKQR